LRQVIEQVVSTTRQPTKEELERVAKIISRLAR
jgi:preprotein translocase subunit Sss1